MDVILPDLIWVGKRCFRNYQFSESSPEDTSFSDSRVMSTNPSQEKTTAFETSEYEEEGETCEMANIPIEELGDGRFRVKMSVASEYFAKIIGRNGDSKRLIEKETKTQLSIPKKGQHGKIAITGFTRRDVTTAFTRINLLVSSARKRMPFTHFVSIPLVVPELKTRFLQFKNDVIQFSRGEFDEDLFQNIDKLHLTIATLVLLTDDERLRAVQVLQSCKDRLKEIVGKVPMEFEIRGVEYMNDDPERVDVLYGRCVDSSGRLQLLADTIVSVLEAEGLIDRQYERVKLHATFMNSLFKVKDESEDNVSRCTFNAKPILENWKDYFFGTVSVDSIHLSQRYSTSQSTKYYVASTEVTLNGSS